MKWDGYGVFQAGRLAGVMMRKERAEGTAENHAGTVRPVIVLDGASIGYLEQCKEILEAECDVSSETDEMGRPLPDEIMKALSWLNAALGEE